MCVIHSQPDLCWISNRNLQTAVDQHGMVHRYRCCDRCDHSKVWKVIDMKTVNQKINDFVTKEVHRLEKKVADIRYKYPEDGFGGKADDMCGNTKNR